MTGRLCVPAMCVALLCLYPFIFSTGGGNTLHTTIAPNTLTDQQIRIVSNQRVFFGHQSVGDNIIQGIRDISASDPRLKLNIVESRHPETVSGPAFIETHVGQNTDPQSKNADFLAIVQQGFEGIALLKYCYVDISQDTDVANVFHAYQATVERTRTNNPAVRIVHVTVPLTVADFTATGWLRSLLGRNSAQNDNIKRSQFNALLRQNYRTELLFDLADVESTRADGTRSFFKNGSGIAYTLAPEYTTDGGHLNAEGRRLAAQKLLEVLASVQ